MDAVKQDVQSYESKAIAVNFGGKINDVLTIEIFVQLLRTCVDQSVLSCMRAGCHLSSELLLLEADVAIY